MSAADPWPRSDPYAGAQAPEAWLVRVLYPTWAAAEAVADELWKSRLVTESRLAEVRVRHHGDAYPSVEVAVAVADADMRAVGRIMRRGAQGSSWRQPVRMVVGLLP